MIGIVDAGNTQVKCAVFDNHKIIASITVPHEALAMHNFFNAHKVKKVFVSSVVHLNNAFLAQIHQHVQVFNRSMSLPLVNAYQTPETLGTDRLANACGAYAHNGFKGPVLAIDCGTCIKFDVVSPDGQYLGGSISPGLTMRLKALHTFTDKLPLLQPEENIKLLGFNTKTSILSGVINGILAEINDFTNQYTQQFSGLKVFLTGGDASFFSSSLKNNIFAVPLLTLHGLNTIAHMNAIEE